MSDTAAAFLDECLDLDALVADLEPDAWARETPAVGWSIAHQIAHLAWTDEVAFLAVTDADGFREQQADPGIVDEEAAKGASAPPAELLDRWRVGRVRLADALRTAPTDAKLPWFGPPMSARSMATARLMETWAHGQDVADALGVRRVPTGRLRDICHLGVRTRDFAYLLRGEQPPAEPFRIELTGPDGELWEWGALRGSAAGGLAPQGPDAQASEEPGTVTGTAEDFCLVATQRRPVAETGLRATGEAARWLTFAQAFAGLPKGARA